MFQIHNRRYTGSKLKLIDWIQKLIAENCEGESFLDLFAGTSIVASRVASDMKSIILNDTLEANELIYKAFYEKSHYRIQELKKYEEVFNNSLIDEDQRAGFFSINYADKYFSLKDCRKIEKIRNYIEDNKKNLVGKEYYILIASLIYSMDRCANTVGHFDSYLKRDIIQDKFSYRLIQPLNLEDQNIEIYRQDANELVKKVYADIVYIDPPYNSRQYCQFYHIYETIVRWDNPKLYGIALKPEAKSLSSYCRMNAPSIFSDLIDNVSCKYIVVSYNNTYTSKSSSSRNKINLESIERTLQKKGKTKRFITKYQYFNAGKTRFDNHQELLFIVEVNNGK